VTGWEALGWALTLMVGLSALCLAAFLVTLIIWWTNRRPLTRAARQIDRADSAAIWAELDKGRRR
jgi:hypothetical protein